VARSNRSGGRTDARPPRKAPKTLHRAHRAPRRSGDASPATDASQGSVPRCRRRKQRPARPILAPHQSLANHNANLTESCGNNKHQRPLGRLFQQPARGRCDRERITGSAQEDPAKTASHQQAGHRTAIAKSRRVTKRLPRACPLVGLCSRGERGVGEARVMLFGQGRSMRKPTAGLEINRIEVCNE
jgi:hypothetical protein